MAAGDDSGSPVYVSPQLEAMTGYSPAEWLADPACDKPPAPDAATYAAMGTAALLRGAAKTGWDLRQFAFAAPDGATRLMRWCAGIARQRSGRFALAALLALLVINVGGLNFYAMKISREIKARHTEMERIATLALPGAPLLLEPAVQLEAAWLRTRSTTKRSDAGLLLGFFAQTGHAPALTALNVSERALRATFADGAAVESNWNACQGAAIREPLLRAGVRCTREGEQLSLEFVRESAATQGSRG